MNEINSGRFFTIGGFIDRDSDFNEQGIPDPFRCITREVFEELHIVISPNDCKCIGVVYDLKNLHPELCFLAHLSITACELANQLEASAELEDAKFIPVQELDQFIARESDAICEGLLGGFDLLRQLAGDYVSER